MPANLPTTPESAPPNFYSQVGQMASGPGQTPGQPGAAGQPAPGSNPSPTDPDHDFLDSVTQMLAILQKMSQMQPRGKDVSKYMQAAGDALKECVKDVFSDGPGGGQPPPGSPPAASGAAAAPDMGAGAAAGGQ